MGQFADNISKATLGQIASLLERNGLPPDEHATSIKRISLYQTVTKGEDGEAETHDLMSVQIAPSVFTTPMWEPVRQGPPVVIKNITPNPQPPAGMHTAVILPDIQMGYFRTESNDYEPVHDEAAMAVALKITKQAKAQQVVLVGDNLDLPEFGKYRLSPRFRDTTQASIDRATVFAGEVRSAAPSAKVVWLAGNHEERLPNYLLDNGFAAYGLRRGNMPDEFPVMSVPFMCRFNEFGIEYKPGYPAGSHWITERLRAIHGTKVASNGSTAHKYLGSEKTSVIYGHVHRREWAERTREDFDGPRTIMAASPGTLARTDGVVPSTKGGYDLDGRPVPVQEDWQQGLAVVTYDPDTGEFWYEQVPIRNGVAMWRGKFYSA